MGFSFGTSKNIISRISLRYIQATIITACLLMTPPSIARSYSKPESIWTVIRYGMTLNHAVTNKRVAYYIKYYQQHPQRLLDITTQAKPYMYEVVKQVQKARLPMELALLPIVESGFRPYIRSSAGALGVWQLMPLTGKRFGINPNNSWFSGRQDIATSTKAALRYLSHLYQLFDSDWLLAVAAYNSGEGNVQAAIDNNLFQRKAISFWRLKLPKQTQNYVPKLLAVSAIIAHPSWYGLRLTPIPNQSITSKVLLKRQIDLHLAAKLAGISQETLRQLNPGFIHFVTPPKGKYYLILPKENLRKFSYNLKKHLKSQSSRWAVYTVKRGDNLTKIARITKNSVDGLKRYNALKSDKIQTGQALIYSKSPQKNSYKRPTRFRVYYVRAGDTLSKIARKYKASVQDLLRWNRLALNEILHVGQRVLVP